MDFLQWMLLWAVVGAEIGLFYPAIVGQFKKDMPKPLSVLAAPGASGRWVRLIIFSLLISAVIVALGFVAFVGSPGNQAKLKATGWLAYVAAFSYGFAAASFFEEPLKQR